MKWILFDIDISMKSIERIRLIFDTVDCGYRMRSLYFTGFIFYKFYVSLNKNSHIDKQYWC